MPKDRPGSPGGKKTADENGAFQVEVHLKPFLGMRPGVYLTVIYALLALAVLFFLLFYKGLRDQGTFLRVSSVPAGAAVTVDGQYAGSTPCEVLVKKGTRKIEASRPFFQPVVMEAHAGTVMGGSVLRKVPHKPLLMSSWKVGKQGRNLSKVSCGVKQSNPMTSTFRLGISYSN